VHYNYTYAVTEIFINVTYVIGDRGDECVHMSLRCDGKHNCLDGSDEVDCHNFSSCDGTHMFRCSDGKFYVYFAFYDVIKL
jgi:hypothetical protein